MDEQIYKNLKSIILKTLNNGIAFTHMSDTQRQDKELEIVEYLKNKGYESYVEEEMIWILSSGWEKLMMMELTKNTLYFTPFKAEEAPVIVYLILQFVSKEYLLKLTSKIKKVEEKQEEIEEDSEEDTEEDKPRPSFDFL